MDEETNSPNRRITKLTEAEYQELHRALQWPEDLAAWDQLNTPTNLTELSHFFN